MLVGYCRLIFHISMLVGFGYVYTYTPFNVFLYPHFYLGITKTIQKIYVLIFVIRYQSMTSYSKPQLSAVKLQARQIKDRWFSSSVLSKT